MAEPQAELLALRQKLERTEKTLRHVESSRESTAALHRSVLKDAEELRALHRLVTDNVTDGVAVLAGGQCLYANPVFYRVTGVDRSIPCSLLTARVPSNCLQVLTSLEPSADFLIQYEDRLSFESPVEIVCKAVQHEGQEARLYLVRDISLRKEDERLRAEQVERETESRIQTYLSFREGQAQKTASLIHNIGNAITGIQNRTAGLSHTAKSLTSITELITEFLAVDPSDPARLSSRDALVAIREAICEVVEDEFNDHIAALSSSADHIACTVHEQRTALRREHFSQPFSLALLLKDAISISAGFWRVWNVSIVSDEDEMPEIVILPRNQLLEVLVNLIKNAVEAIIEANEIDGRAGTIKITCRKRPNARFEIAISDNGIGVEMAAQSRLFDFGYTTKDEGTGLGLHSVANFIQSLDGSVAAESSGHLAGTSIFLNMPLAWVCID